LRERGTLAVKKKKGGNEAKKLGATRRKNKQTSDRKKREVGAAQEMRHRKSPGLFIRGSKGKKGGWEKSKNTRKGDVDTLGRGELAHLNDGVLRRGATGDIGGRHPAT